MSITLLCRQLQLDNPNDSGLRYSVSGFFLPYSVKSLTIRFHGIHGLKKIGLLKDVVVCVGWPVVETCLEVYPSIP